VWVLGAALAALLDARQAVAQPHPPGEGTTHEVAAEEGEGDEDATRALGRPAVMAVPLVDPARPVVVGRGVTMRADEVLRRVQDAPQALLQRYATEPGALQELVDTLAAERLLAVEARRQGLESDPIVQAATERALVARYRALQLTARGGDPASVPEADVRRWYDQHPDRFHIPERRRVRVIFSPDRREAMETLRLTTQMRRRARAGADFRRLAGTRNTDPVLRTLFGELRNVTRDPIPGAVPDPEIPPLDGTLRAAAFEVAHEGEVLPRIVPGRWGTQDGFFVLRLVARRPAIERSYSDSAEWIRHRIVLERRVAAEHEEVARLRTTMRVSAVPAAEIVRFDPVPVAMPTSPGAPGAPGVPGLQSSSGSTQQGLGMGRPR